MSRLCTITLNEKLKSIRLALLTALAATGVLAAGGPAYSQQARDITIGFSSGSLSSGSLRVAKEMGLYEKYGLNPRFVIAESGNVAVSGLIGGSFDAVVANTGDMITAQAAGQKVVSLSAVYDGLGGTVILSKAAAEKVGVSPTAPIKDRFKALETLTIAMPSPTSNYTLAFKAAAAGLGANIKTTYINAASQQAAFDSGAIHGFMSSAPNWMPSIANGKAFVWISGPKGDIPREYRPTMTLTLQMMRSVAEANPAIVKGLNGVLADFVEALNTRPADVKAATAKVYSGVDAPSLELFFTYEGQSWKARRPTVEDMVHEIQFTKAGGVSNPKIESLDPTTLVF